MAVKSLESLVLGGIRVVSGVKTSLVREDSKPMHGQAPASLSHPRVAFGDLQRRPMSPSWPMADYQTDSRPDLFDEVAAIRAGRLVSSASVPVSCPVEAAVSGRAGRTIRARWSLAEGGPCSTAVRRFGCLASTRTSAANDPLWHPKFSRIEADGMKQMPLTKQAGGKSRLPAMPSASTRGA